MSVISRLRRGENLSDTSYASNSCSSGNVSRKSSLRSIPSVQTSSYLNALETTRNLVGVRDQQKCFCCSYISVALNICHIIPKNQHQKACNPSLLISHMMLMSSFPRSLSYTKNAALTHPAHQDNLILLCANCQAEFDSSIPVITIMPTDLQYFIGYEVDDYQRRLVAASSGCEIQRKVPTSQDYI
jgi:hypothetical protein